MFQNLSIGNGYMKKRDEQGKFLKRMGSLLEKGYTFSEAVDFLLIPDHPEATVLKTRILHSLQEGVQVSKVITKELSLPTHVSAQIYFAEFHGQMGATLMGAGDYLLQKQKNQERLKRVIQYPLMLIIIAGMMMVLLRNVLFPKFETLYSSMGYEPSTGVQLLLSFVKAVPLLLAGILAVLLSAGVILFFFRHRISPVTISIHTSRIPFLSRFFKLAHTHFFARELGFLLSNGVSITESLRIIEQQTFRPTLQYVSGELIQGLKSGMSLHECAGAIPFFQSEVAYIIHHGQSNGRLPEELQLYGDMCFVELEERSGALFKYIQPVIFSFVGLFIMAIYFSIMMPLFQMMQGV
ncbi:competence type IV pilus assembly protein ComGB [Rossellomorea marisflavi]|uniref:competence type IV pilus assembly protein ComGB n=1 Tax=Rossellomorea marisflavi TaxID=189381 RepID=UPI003D2F0207